VRARELAAGQPAGRAKLLEGDAGRRQQVIGGGDVVRPERIAEAQPRGQLAEYAQV